MTWAVPLSKGMGWCWLGTVIIAITLWGSPTGWAQERQGLPTSNSPTGEARVDRAPETAVFTSDELRRLREGRYRAAIAMQALDTPWNALQIQAITETL